MTTIIQQAPGNAATDVLGALNAVLQGIQANRDKGQEQQLKLLEILAKQPGAQPETVAPDQLQQPNFLDYLVGAQPRTLAGAPAARFGGTALTVGRLPLLSADSDITALTKALTPPPDASQSGPILQTPMPLSNVTVPQAPAAAPAPAPAAPPVAPPAPTAGTGQEKPTWRTAQPSAEVQAAVTRASASTGVPVSHLLGVGAVESALDPGATGPMTRFGWQAKGVLQLSPDTGKRLGNLQTDADFYNVDKNVAAGALAWKEALQKAGGDPRVAYQKYYNPGASDADTNKVLLSIRRFEQGGADTSQMVAAPGAPPLAPDVGTTPQRREQAQAERLRQRDPAPAQAPTGPTITPPGAATGKVAGAGAPTPPTAPQPSAPAPAPAPAQPVASAPTPAQPVSADTDREAQLTQRRLDANPEARMVPVPGVGMRSQAWARDYLNRLRQFSAPGLYGTPDNLFKYNEAKRKAADDLDKDEVQLRKDVQGAVEKHPGQEALFKNVRSQADLAGRAEQARSPGQLQTAATADLQSMLDRAPRDANGTYTPESLQAIARVQAYWGGYGVKPEAFKPQLDAAGVGAAEDAMKQRAQLPVKQAEEQQRLRTQQEEDPFKGDEQASIIARNKTKEWGLPQSQFTKEMREIVLQEAAAKRAKDAGDIEAAKTDAQSLEKMDVYTRTALLGILKEDGTPASKYTAEQFRRAQAQGDTDKAHDEYLKQEALRQAKLNAPVTDAALLARYTDLKTGAKHPSEGESIPQMQAKGYVYLDKPQQDTLRNGVSSLRFVDRMQTLLLGGTDYDGSFTGTPGAQFPGLYQAKKEATDIASRVGQTFQVRTGQIAGKTLAQWASIYDRLVDSSLGHIGREMGGERGHFTDEDAKRAKRFFADVGLTGKNLATSKPEAEKLFGQVRGLLNDRISSAVGVGRGEALPWDPEAPQSKAAAQAGPPAPPEAAPESEADAYRRLTGQQPQRTP